MGKKKKLILVPTMFLTIALVMFLPGLCPAGSLEPSEPPGPTMKTLDEIYTRPVWDMFDKTFVDWPDNPRFAVCDNGTTQTSDDMVLDKETGLVWDRDLSGRWGNTRVELKVAHSLCNELANAGRLGWRLPTLWELSSLVDRSHWNPALPSGHPFINVQSGYVDGKEAFYWTASTSPNINLAYTLQFDIGKAWNHAKDDLHYFWCVRGGQGTEASLVLW